MTEPSGHHHINAVEHFRPLAEVLHLREKTAGTALSECRSCDGVCAAQGTAREPETRICRHRNTKRIVVRRCDVQIVSNCEVPVPGPKVADVQPPTRSQFVLYGQ